MLGCFSDKLHVDHKNDTPQTKLSPVNRKIKSRKLKSRKAKSRKKKLVNRLVYNYILPCLTVVVGRAEIIETKFVNKMSSTHQLGKVQFCVKIRWKVRN